MTTPGGEPAPSSTRVEAHAEDQSLQYVAGRDQNFFTGPMPAPAAAMQTLPRDIAAFTGREPAVPPTLGEVAAIISRHGALLAAHFGVDYAARAPRFPETRYAEWSRPEEPPEYGSALSVFAERHGFLGRKSARKSKLGFHQRRG